MYTIRRHIDQVVVKSSMNSKSVLLTGPRQVGKSTLLKHLFADVNQVTFDDDFLLSQAKDDPNLFLINNPCPLMIDEVQKCPSIFHRVKMVLDNTDSYGNFFFTGSQKLHLMESVSESLSGRVSILELDGLSMREITNVDFNKHFVLTESYLEEREKKLKPYRKNIWKTIHRGFYPELHANKDKDWVEFYQSYVKTYLERDVNQLIKTSNHLTFVKFMTSVASRTGQPLNCDNIANEINISSVTVREWISILEKSGIIYLLKPYTPSSLKRAIKSPKLYFRDTGLCCYLTRWLTYETLQNGNMAGAMFETFVVNEILKSYSNEGMDYDFGIFYYNERDKKIRKRNGIEVEIDGEIDLIIQEDGVLYPVEIKMSASPNVEMASEFDVLDKVPDAKRGMGAIICLYERKMLLRDNLMVLPIEYV